MGINNKGIEARFQRKLNADLDGTLDDLEYDLEELFTDGETEMKHYIDDRGVRDNVPNNEGRRDTDAMYDSAGHKVTRRGDVIRGRLGYINGAPDYAEWQERGTYGQMLDAGETDRLPVPPDSPRGIRPMLALADSATHLAEEMDRRFPGVRKRNIGPIV